MISKVKLLAAFVACFHISSFELANAQSKGAAVREAVEFVLRKFSKEATDEGAEIVTRKIESIGAKYGDQGLEALKKVGPRAAQLIDDAGTDGVQAARMLAKFGDEAAWVVGNSTRRGLVAKFGDEVGAALIKHGEIAEPLLASGGKAAGEALLAVSTQNGRRLAMIASDAPTASLAKNPEVLNVIGRYGDDAMNFIWKNKGVLAGGAVLTAFLADPKPFIDGTTKLADTAITQVAKPVAVKIGESTNWTTVILSVLGIVILYVGLRRVSRR